MKTIDLRRSIHSTLLACALLSLPFASLAAPGGNGGGGGTAGAGQASITLKNQSAAFCNKHENKWTLSKTPNIVGKASVDQEVTWTITATKDTSAPVQLCVDGYIEVQNTGSANATIGNVVINLQNQKLINKKNTWVSLAADIADATSGDSATSALIVAAASSEVILPGGCNDRGNYCTTSPTGAARFTKTSASGTVVFTDADSDEVFAITPQLSLTPGETVKFYYTASYNLNIASGTQLRAEAIVTFGNAGLRGGSGSSLTSDGLDVNGSDSISADEKNVRSVPARVTNTVPALEECNNSVTLSDTFTDETGASGNVSPVATPGSPPWGIVSTSGSWTHTYKIIGPPGGSVTNRVILDGGDDTTVTIPAGFDELGAPLTATFVCCAGADVTAASVVEINSCQEDSNQPGCGSTTESCLDTYTLRQCVCEVTNNPFYNPDDVMCRFTKAYCTYTQGGYQGGGQPAQLFLANYATVFSPNGLTIGLDDGAGPNHDATWTADATGADNLQTYLAGGGKSAALSDDTSNATSVSGGTLGQQAAALTLNVGFSGLSWMPSGFGSLKLTDPTSSLNGFTVSEILGVANTALGTGSLPSGYSFGGLNALITDLNESFDNCVRPTATSWAGLYLTE